MLVLILAGVFVVLITGKQPTQKEKEGISSPTKIPLPSLFPTSSPTPTLVPRKASIIQELVTLMPVVTDEFNIEYLPPTQSINVTIKKSPYEQSRKNAEKWLSDHGINPSDYKQFNIGFSSLRYIY